MKITIKFFGKHKEIVGIKKMDMEIEEGKDIEYLFERLCKKFPELREVKDYTFISLNNCYTSFAEVLHNNDEVAFFPPVGGG